MKKLICTLLVLATLLISSSLVLADPWGTPSTDSQEPPVTTTATSE